MHPQQKKRMLYWDSGVLIIHFIYNELTMHEQQKIRSFEGYFETTILWLFTLLIIANKATSEEKAILRQLPSRYLLYL